MGQSEEFSTEIENRHGVIVDAMALGHESAPARKNTAAAKKSTVTSSVGRDYRCMLQKTESLR